MKLENTLKQPQTSSNFIGPFIPGLLGILLVFGMFTIASADDYPFSYEYSHDPKGSRIGLNLHLHCDVWAVMPKSPAEKAGIKKGDRILGIKAKWIQGNRRILSLKTFKSFMSRVKPGTEFTLLIARGDFIHEITVKAAKRTSRTPKLF